MPSPSSSGSARRPAGRSSSSSSGGRPKQGDRGGASSARGSGPQRSTPRTGGSGKPGERGNFSPGKPRGAKPGIPPADQQRASGAKGKRPPRDKESTRPSGARRVSAGPDERAPRPRRELSPEEALYRGIPEEITGEELDRRVLAELRTLPEGLATQVARLLVAASVALEQDPESALAYAQEAKRKAGRVSVVREALGIAAYAAGDYAQALAELRAVRRMTGSDEHVPMMADCERGLGRPRKALELLSSVPEDSMDTEMRVECRIVAAGARRDLGQDDAALVLLQIPALKSRSKEAWVARLRYAYADALEAVGRTDDASTWFAKSMEVDEEGMTDAAERLAALEGVTFEEEWEPGEED